MDSTISLAFQTSNLRTTEDGNLLRVPQGGSSRSNLKTSSRLQAFNLSSCMIASSMLPLQRCWGKPMGNSYYGRHFGNSKSATQIYIGFVWFWNLWASNYKASTETGLSKKDVWFMNGQVRGKQNRTWGWRWHWQCCQGFLFPPLGSPFSCLGCVTVQAHSHDSRILNLVAELGKEDAFLGASANIPGL